MQQFRAGIKLSSMLPEHKYALNYYHCSLLSFSSFLYIRDNLAYILKVNF